MTEGIASKMRLFKLIANMNDKKLFKKSKEITIKTRTKTKLITEVFELSQEVRVSNSIRILNDNIFVKFQPLNKYSKGIKRNVGYQRTDCIFKVELL